MPPWKHHQFWYIIFGLALILLSYGIYFLLPHHYQSNMPVEGNTAPPGQYWYEDEPDYYEVGDKTVVQWDIEGSVLIGFAKKKNAEEAAGNFSKLKLEASGEGSSGNFEFIASEAGYYCIIIAKATDNPTGWIYMNRYTHILTNGHVCGMLLGVIIMVVGAILTVRAMKGKPPQQQTSEGPQGQYGPYQAPQQPQYPVCPSCNVYLDQYRVCPQCGRRF